MAHGIFRRTLRAGTALALGVALAASSAAAEAKSSGKTVVAEAITIEALADRSALGGDTPADGLRAAARRTFGLEPNTRRVAPSTLTADALYTCIRAEL